MKPLQFCLSAITAIGLLASSAAQEQQRPLLRFVLLTDTSDNDHITVVQNAATQAAQEQGGTLEVRNSEDLEAVIANKPSALIVAMDNRANLEKSLNASSNAGLPTVSVYNGGELALRLGALGHVGQDEQGAGQAMGRRLKTLNLKTVTCINAQPNNARLVSRCKGVSEGLGAKIAMLNIKPEDGIPVSRMVRVYLQKNPNVQALVGLDASITGEVLEGLADSGRAGKTSLVGFDVSLVGLKAVMDKKMLLIADAQPWLQGYLAVTLLGNHLRTGLWPNTRSIQSGPSFVTPSNAASVLEAHLRGQR